MRALLVGDVHATPEELEDCQRLVDEVVRVAEDKALVRTVVFMGDLYNTHNVVRVEVLAFWRRAFERMAKAGLDVYALVGNHDYAGEGLAEHALMAHADQIEVVEEPMELFPGVLMLPYVSGQDAFERLCSDNASTTVLCHQTFEGSKYENGFFAPDGMDPNLIPQKFVISGHIHTPQAFDKVTYIGAPRWRTLSDADVPRSIVLVEFDEQGNVASRQDYSTGSVCRQICYRLDTPEAPIEGGLAAGVDWRVDIKGPADWIERRKKELAGPGVRIRTFSTTKAAPKLRESQGIGTAFASYLKSHTAKYGTPTGVLEAFAKERLGVC